MPAPTIEVQDLSIRYGDLVAVDQLTFSVQPGELVALLGPNGAGKTSTVEAMEGYRRPSAGKVRVLGLDPTTVEAMEGYRRASAGKVRVLGLDPTTDRAQLTPRIGVMLQEGGVYPAARPREMVRLYAAYYDDPVDPDDMLDQVGLRARAGSTWRSLSGGEKQRLSLALALIGRPEVAFLDEPTAGVDIAGRQTIRQLVLALREAGVTVLLTTHDLEDAEKLADRVLIVDRGRLVAEGTPADLQRSDGGEHVLFAAAPGIDVAALGAALGVPVDEPTPGEYRVSAPGEPRLVAALTSWLAEHDLPVDDIRVGRKRLEDVFLRLTGEDE